MDFEYFCHLLFLCVTTPMFYVPAGILSFYGIVAVGMAATGEAEGARLSRGLLLPSLIAMVSLVIGTIYRNSQADILEYAMIANVAVWLLQIPVVAFVTWRSRGFWIGAFCFGIAQFWLACMTFCVAQMSIASLHP